ncbi:beta-galactosidase [Salibaculum sp.]|uniref:beta-galactosidase n=1 Tax=Salibaculum sp. TaxID=2855480 RepID=UPI002B48D1FD|nr:beta-galactosidase [Salibaculum sp.]HKL69420.1 beta-galactosidase [Salibaculum sp.]
MQRTLGTCYYPEHWPEEVWHNDAARMAELGLTWVRIGEFAWGRIEPTPGDLRWDWLDRAIEVLGQAGLKVVLGTPTATPPRWVVDKHPDMLAVDAEGRPRKFGSRRHYCFSHTGYLDECRRIVTLMAERYGRNPHVEAWQTDNEYGCHDTILSYSEAARQAFRDWLAQRYQSPEALNRAWGNVFWSMDYATFDEVDLPNLTVTEPNPSHALDFRRFSSDQVVRFNRVQTEIIHAHSDAPIAHNYMGRVTDFDHYKVGDDLDIASWDSYPLGFLENVVGAEDAHKRRYNRQGDPDFQAFHHDLYRAVGRGRWWVMEQQPGPVNWAPYNPAPLPGMVRLWSWEAFAHGAEAVCYFRWRQAPFAQEQMHAGLLRPDSAEAPAMKEARQVAAEIAKAPEVQPVQAPAALIFDYESDWAWTVQPHGAGLSCFGLVLDCYRALRRAGLSVDIIRAEAAALAGYKAIFAPGLMILHEDLKAALQASEAQVVLGPRAGARTRDMAIPSALPPGLPGVDLRVARVESMRPDMPLPLVGGGAIVGYLDEIEGTGATILETTTGQPVAQQFGSLTYVAGWLDEAGFDRLIREITDRAGLAVRPMPEGVRIRDTSTERFWFNYSNKTVTTEAGDLPPAGVLRQPL